MPDHERHRRHRARDRDDPPRDVHGDRDGEEDEPRVAEDRDSRDDAGQRREREGATLVRRERAERENGEHEPVEHLPVQVDVVPDDVRMERRDQRGDEPDAGRAQPRPDLEDDERRRDGDDDLRDPDREPRAPEREVEAGEEPAVERLGVRRRDTGEEAERPVVDERRREAVALVDELLEDRLALAHEHERGAAARLRPRRRVRPSIVSSSFDDDGRHGTGTVRGRVLPR